ncbi:MAG: prepilin-type N-terminal cleavage/methylation domain-containing protein, partial [Deltaproteobacteria bacterium]|nr:prepilin-type N-terminal cleavage/methylation domain-containing protein [Deltaproteobacteria bacterium]
MERAMRDDRGFTIVELVIAMAILGVLTAGIFSLYNTQHKVTHIEADVVDVQQNQRLAVESITRDLRMAGFALTGGENPVALIQNNAGANGSDVVVLNTGAASGTAVRINADSTVSVSSGSAIAFTVASADEASFLSAGDAVRVINPGDKSQPAATSFVISAIDSSVPSVTVTPLASAGATDFKKGFLMVKTGSSAPDTYPNTIRYCLGPVAGCAPDVSCPAGNCLMRIVNGSADDGSIAASNISDFQLSYVLDSGSVEAAPADASQVRDVKITVTAETEATKGLSGAPKVREMTAS